MHRDILGRVVREAWVKWALTQPNPKVSWLLSYDQIAESGKEVDRQIGEAVASALVAEWREIAEKVETEHAAWLLHHSLVHSDECGFRRAAGRIRLDAERLCDGAGHEGPGDYDCKKCGGRSSS